MPQAVGGFTPNMTLDVAEGMPVDASGRRTSEEQACQGVLQAPHAPQRGWPVHATSWSAFSTAARSTLGIESAARSAWLRPGHAAETLSHILTLRPAFVERGGRQEVTATWARVEERVLLVEARLQCTSGGVTDPGLSVLTATGVVSVSWDACSSASRKHWPPVAVSAPRAEQTALAAAVKAQARLVVAQRLEGSGSHRRLVTNVQLVQSGGTSAQSCGVLLMHELPVGVYVDAFELQELRRHDGLRVAMFRDKVDLEAPARGHPLHSNQTSNPRESK